MRLPIALAVLLVATAPAWGADRSVISVAAFVRAINKVEGRSFSPARARRVSPKDVRLIRCTGHSEEPTEFECAWLEHAAGRWIERRTNIAIDGEGARVID